MDRLVQALENSNRSIQVNVKDFEGKLNADECCDWIASLQAFLSERILLMKEMCNLWLPS